MNQRILHVRCRGFRDIRQRSMSHPHWPPENTHWGIHLDLDRYIFWARQIDRTWGIRWSMFDTHWRTQNADWGIRLDLHRYIFLAGQIDRTLGIRWSMFDTQWRTQNVH